jgi:hypothetical protein
MTAPINNLNNITKALYFLTSLFFIVFIFSSFPENNRNSVGMWVGGIGLAGFTMAIYSIKLQIKKIKSSSETIKQILVRERLKTN